MSSRVLLTYAPVGLLFLLLIPFSYSFRTTFAGKESVCYLAVASLHLICSVYGLGYTGIAFSVKASMGRAYLFCWFDGPDAASEKIVMR